MARIELAHTDRTAALPIELHNCPSSKELTLIFNLYDQYKFSQSERSRTSNTPDPRSGGLPIVPQTDNTLKIYLFHYLNPSI